MDNHCYCSADDLFLPTQLVIQKKSTSQIVETPNYNKVIICNLSRLKEEDIRYINAPLLANVMLTYVKVYIHEQKSIIIEVLL